MKTNRLKQNYPSMNKFIFVLSIILLVTFSCKNGEEQTIWPEDLQGKKTLLSTKNKQLNSLQEEITKLKREILKLEPQKEKEPILVSSIRVGKEKFERFTTVQGSVQADNTVNVSAEIGGRIMELTVDEGDAIRRGQVVAKIDMDLVRTQLAEIETSLSLANTVYERQKRLWEKNIGSEIQYLQAKNNKERLENSKDLINTQLTKSVVYAPISGVVEMKFAKQGEVVGPGTPIINILNTNKLKVVADIPENFLGKIKKGDKVIVNYPALDKTVNARVSLLGRTINPSNRTFKVEVKTSTLGGKLKPNLLSEIQFIDYAQRDVISVPLHLIQEEVNGDKFIFVARKEGEKYIAHKNRVVLGESTEGKIIITEGLEEGDIVLTEGSRNVSSGDPLLLPNI